MYKQIRDDVRTGLPFYPTGMPHFSDEWFSFGLDCGDTVYLAVWRMNGNRDSFEIPLDDAIESVECIYPAGLETRFSHHENVLTVQLKNNTARLFRIRKE